MGNIKLSCIVPDYKDPVLHKTVDSILDNSDLGDQLEVIIALDGVWNVKPIRDDLRVKVIHLGKNRGMRGAINAGVDIAKGEYLMRTDAHCSFAKGFDKIIIDNMEDNWIVTPRRYYLDTIKWKRMNLPPVDFCKLVIRGEKFTAASFKERDEEMKDVMIAETEGMQGSVWFMKRSWWDKVIGELQIEGYGNLIQDSHEMHFKTLKAGGKMMLNKMTWHSHRERNFGRTHNNGAKENPANCDAGYKYALDLWGDYYRNELRPKWDLMYANEKLKNK